VFENVCVYVYLILGESFFEVIFFKMSVFLLLTCFQNVLSFIY
jgi:hypothetical protein